MVSYGCNFAYFLINLKVVSILPSLYLLPYIVMTSIMHRFFGHKADPNFETIFLWLKLHKTLPA